MEKSELSIDIVDVSFKGDVKYQRIAFLGFVTLLIAPFSDDFGFEICLVSFGLIIVGSLLMSKKSQFKTNGSIVFYSNNIVLEVDASRQINAVNIVRVVFFMVVMMDLHDCNGGNWQA